MIYDLLTQNGYIFELLIASFLFVYSLKRRPQFILRISVSILAYVAIALGWQYIFPATIPLDIIKYTLLFIVSVLAVYGSFDTTIWVAAFLEIGAYTVEHILYKLSTFFLLLIGDNSQLYQIIYIITFLVVYTAAYFLFARQIERKEAVHLENKQIILLGFTIVLVIISFQIISDSYIDMIPIGIYGLIVVYDVFSSIFALFFQYGMFRSGLLVAENKLLEHLLQMQKKYFEISKENIAIINIKFHDLKHYLSRFGNRLSPHEIEEVNSLLSVYSSILKTGNEALDIILAEKNLLCEHKKIRLDCMIDGQALFFMHASDVYSLFGNAIDNAIEAVSQLGDHEKHIISVSVKESMGHVSIHFENYFVGELNYHEGLPVSTKNDQLFHGFGMKSIRLIAEKYKGEFTFHVADGKFNLSLLLPQPSRQS